MDLENFLTNGIILLFFASVALIVGFILAYFLLG